MNIYEDAGKDMYDIYYDGIIKDAYDTEDYDVWSDASSDIYVLITKLIANTVFKLNCTHN